VSVADISREGKASAGNKSRSIKVEPELTLEPHDLLTIVYLLANLLHFMLSTILVNA
jgi:hypothetical protein